MFLFCFSNKLYIRQKKKKTQMNKFTYFGHIGGHIVTQGYKLMNIMLT